MNANPKSGVIEIHGRQYETVALRVFKFRAVYPAHTLKTVMVRLDQDEVLIEAQILDESGRLIANGHAQEFRQSSTINKTSYVENCETSAIGRALAAFGLGGSEFATADELKRVIVDKREPSNPLTDMKTDAFEALPEEQKKFLRELAANVTALTDEGREAEAYGVIEHNNLEMEEKLGLWGLLGSKARSAVKRAGDQARLAAKVEKKNASAGATPGP